MNIGDLVRCPFRRQAIRHESSKTSMVVVSVDIPSDLFSSICCPRFVVKPEDAYGRGIKMRVAFQAKKAEAYFLASRASRASALGTQAAPHHYSYSRKEPFEREP
jgi:hypothetical protein